MGEDDIENSMHGAEPSIDDKLADAGFGKPRISHSSEGLTIRNKYGNEMTLDESELEDFLKGFLVIGEDASRLIKRWYRISSKKLMDQYKTLDRMRETAVTPTEKRNMWFAMEKIAAQLADTDRKKRELGFCYNVDGEHLDKLYKIIRQNSCESFNMGSFKLDLPLKHCDQAANTEYQPKDDVLTTDDFFNDFKNASSLIKSIRGRRMLGSDGTPYECAYAFARGVHFFSTEKAPVSLEAQVSRNGDGVESCIRVQGIELSIEQFNSAMKTLPRYKGAAGMYGTENDRVICLYDDALSSRKILLKGTPELLERDTIKLINHLLAYNGTD